MEKSYSSDLQEHKYSCPATVDYIASAHPHVDDEDHEVAMVIVSYAIKHPRCRAGQVKLPVSEHIGTHINL